MSKTEDLGERMHDIGVEIATISVKEYEGGYEGEHKNYINEFSNLINQILKAIKDMDMEFVIKEAKYPEANPASYEGEDEAISATEEAFISQGWHKTEKIEE